MGSTRSAGRSADLLGGQVEKCCGSEDGDALERMEGQQVLIPGDNHVGATMEGDFEELVVTWIATGADGSWNCDEFRYRPKIIKKLFDYVWRNVYR